MKKWDIASKWTAKKFKLLLMPSNTVVLVSVITIILIFLSSLITSGGLLVLGTVSMINISAGVALSILIVKGRRYWPCIILGYLGVYLYRGVDVAPTMLLAVIGAIEAYSAHFILDKYILRDFKIKNNQDLIGLLIFGALLPTFFSALLNGATLYMFNVANITNSYTYIQLVRLWLQSNEAGIFLVVLTVLKLKELKNSKHVFKDQSKIIEFVLIFVLIFITNQVVFMDWFEGTLKTIGYAYWVFLFMTIVAIRFNQYGVVLVVVMTSLQAVFGAVNGFGFFARDIAQTNLSNFLIYIQVVALAGMTQSIVIRENQLQASYDFLTQLPNRRRFMERLHQSIAIAMRRNNQVGIMMLDLDRFKEVNDTMGHNVGDELLILVAKRIKLCLRESDIVSRIGGDEFTVILPELKNADNLSFIANKINETIREPFSLSDKKVYISVSIGVAIYPDDAVNTIDLIKYSDQAMYNSKMSGKDTFSYFSKEMQSRAILRSELSSDIYKGLEEQQFSMHYQPIIDLRTNQIVKAEALIRWHHPVKGLISPDVFIGISEETGSIDVLGSWISDTVLNQLASWRRLYDTEITIAINMSPKQFLQEENNIKIREKIKELQIPEEKIILEITENVLLDDNEIVSNEISQYTEANIGIAIDDFGTGYSSLSYLKKYPIGYLKIDKSFTDDVENDLDTQELVTAIVNMAHAMKLEVIVEGVEDEFQHNFMKKIGCDYGQGYYYSRPIDKNQFSKLLEESFAKDSDK